MVKMFETISMVIGSTLLGVGVGTVLVFILNREELIKLWKEIKC